MSRKVHMPVMIQRTSESSMMIQRERNCWDGLMVKWSYRHWYFKYFRIQRTLSLHSRTDLWFRNPKIWFRNPRTWNLWFSKLAIHSSRCPSMSRRKRPRAYKFFLTKLNIDRNSRSEWSATYLNRTHLSSSIRICIYICIYICIHIHVYVYMYMCL